MNIKELEEIENRKKKFENEIDKLAKDYFKEFLQQPDAENTFKSDGYYAILNYCLKEIEWNDKNSSLGYCANVKKED